MKLLKDILHKTGITEIHGNADIECRSVNASSDDVLEEALFVAVRGIRHDGHDFIPQAIEYGAIAIVCERYPESFMKGITYVKVKDSAYALGQIASNFYDNPSSRMKLIGITGTNGKTTTATLLFELFRSLGYSAGLISTICNRINDEVISTNYTTPDPVRLNALLYQMIARGCKYCFMEVSSHALAQHRVAGIDFTGAVFTNITHDHLDYHHTFDEYLKTKKSFFDALPLSAFALINIDDRNGNVMVQNTSARIHTYSLTQYADFRCNIVESQFAGMNLQFDDTEVWVRLTGKFNAYNMLAVYATATLLGREKTEVLTGLSALQAAEGRFDYIITPGKITAIVDYAHTPDALKNVLSTIREIRSGDEHIITVCGAGGDRDASKRPLLAKIAAELSNRVILTSDNPRTEDPDKIISEMKTGVDPQNVRKVLAIVNRREAINTAVALAKPGDIILLAGKGHEKYQEINGEKHPFDDKAILHEILTGENQ